MAGRKKRNIGRKPKNFEKKIQTMKKYSRGRPRKKNEPPLPPEMPNSLRSEIAESIKLPSPSWSMHLGTSKADFKMWQIAGLWQSV